MKQKKRRGRILSKIRDTSRRIKSRVRLDRSVSSKSTEYGLDMNEGVKSENNKTELAESEFTETPVQTTDTIISNQESVSLFAFFTAIP